MPPHDLHTEDALLATLLLHAETFPRVSPVLTRSSFYSESNGLVFETMAALAQKGTPIDVTTVGLSLKERNNIERIGGVDRLHGILAATASPSNVEVYARSIAEKATVRRVMREAQDIEANARIGHYENVQSFLANAQERIRMACQGTILNDERAKARTLSDVIAAWKAEGPLQHFPTGIKVLDEATGGGPCFGTRWYVNGAPNGAKTALVVQIAHTFAKAGLAVGFLAIDEEASDITTRFAQRLGWSRRHCEEREEQIMQTLSEAVEGLPIRIYGPEYTIEGAARDLYEFANKSGRRAAFFVDSIQVASSERGKNEKEARALIGANVAALRKVASEFQLIAIATAEMNRNAYRNEDASERTNDMASAAESRSIEYSARVMLSMRSVKGESDLVEVKIPKNKHGYSDGAFYLRLDRSSMTLVESEAPIKEAKATKTDEVATDARAILQVVLSHPGIGARELRAQAMATSGIGSTRVDAARALLENGFEGYRLTNRGTPKLSELHVVSIGGAHV